MPFFIVHVVGTFRPSGHVGGEDARVAEDRSGSGRLTYQFPDCP